MSRRLVAWGLLLGCLAAGQAWSMDGRDSTARGWQPAGQPPDSATLALALDAMGFFQDQEYFGLHATGYTLPGFYLRPRLLWRVERSVSLEAGAHWLHLWGAHRYPAGVAYGVWPQHDDSVCAPAHVLPWMRIDVRLGRHSRLTVGNLHHADGHGLPLPLYNPKRLTAADPEAGVQWQLDCRHLKADVWVDWREFIWKHSPTQEQFVAGAAARWSLPLPWGGEVRVPVAAVGQHTGGQGLQQAQPVHNAFNLTAGAGCGWQRGRWKADGSVLALGSFSDRQVQGTSFARGFAVYPQLSVGCGPLAVSAAYWQGRRFLPIMGSSLFSSLSAVDGTTVFAPCRLLTMGVRYDCVQHPSAKVRVEGRCYYYPGESHPAQYYVGLLADLSPKLTLLP